MEVVNIIHEEKRTEIETCGLVMCEMCGESLAESKYNEHIEKCSSITLEEATAEKKEIAQVSESAKDPSPCASSDIPIRIIDANTGDRDQQVSCPFCSAIIAHGRNLKRHIISKHGNTPLVKCHYCHKKFASEELLNRHILLNHENPLSFRCNLCAHFFNEKCHLENHILRIHTTIRRFKCVNCSYGVMTRQTFLTHVKACVFKNNEAEFNAKANELLNNIEKRSVVCPMCKIDCSDISALMEHMKCHNISENLNSKSKRNSRQTNRCENKNVDQLSENLLIESKKLKRIKTYGKEESKKLRSKPLPTQGIQEQIEKSPTEFNFSNSCGLGNRNDLFYDSEILKKLFYQKQNSDCYRQNCGNIGEYNFVSNGFQTSYSSENESIPIARENGLSLEMRTVLANALTILYREILLDEDLEKYRCKLCSITCLSATALENHMKRHL